MELKATSPAQYSGVTLGQIVPDDDHGDAAGQADQDQPHHIFVVSGEKGHRQPEHQNRSDQPVLDQRQGQHLGVAEDLVQLLVAHLGQGRIHHQNQADGDGQVGGADLEGVDNLADPRDTGNRPGLRPPWPGRSKW